MALVNKEIAQCKRCKSFGPKTHVNHRQSQMYCKPCQPLVDRDEIDKAVVTLLRHKVTPEMIMDFLKKKGE